MSSQSRHSRRTVPTQRSMCAFAFGACTGVRMILIPWFDRRASKAGGNFASRSWIRKRTCVLWSSSCISRSRLLQHPAGVRFAGDREVLDAAAADGDEREHVQAPQPDGVDGEKVAGKDGFAVRSQEAAPGLGIAP